MALGRCRDRQGDVAVADRGGKQQHSAGNGPHQAQIREQDDRGVEQSVWVLLPGAGEGGRAELFVQLLDQCLQPVPLHQDQPFGTLRRRGRPLGRRPGQIVDDTGLRQRGVDPCEQVPLHLGLDRRLDLREGAPGPPGASAILAIRRPAARLTAPPLPGKGLSVNLPPGVGEQDALRPAFHGQAGEPGQVLDDVVAPEHAAASASRSA